MKHWRIPASDSEFFKVYTGNRFQRCKFHWIPTLWIHYDARIVCIYWLGFVFDISEWGEISKDGLVWSWAFENEKDC